ncbi:hypothetical protein MBM_09859 [Drepanopeziza brunnea f. sp. 'multigermtubi' MB_m1]|uniref:Uncharacterized protein n=1 Tax=Marssonina brunnea f. sp. multigermtubi (strain MB_m1) TaxID=1072389 RepID=K1WGK0_MARBU|nr:uncharacterized protein MBM_09859 [Drepanopeziza brunnea f. sp. 'multigermtubi' MB_m1]EKD11996.1 hypothetical protein MBM_09859 [Drepanopeziza brunnea f. sp. 'multigermtubi' MB_m1]
MGAPIIELIDPAASVKTPTILNNFGSEYAGCLVSTEIGTALFYFVVAAPFDVATFAKISSNSLVKKLDIKQHDSSQCKSGLVMIADALHGVLYT